MIIIMMAFAVLAVHAFGYHTRHFHNTATALSTLVHIAMGDLM